MQIAKSNTIKRERGWPPSTRPTTVLLLFAFYTFLCVVVAYDHPKMLMLGANPALNFSDPRYFNWGNLHDRVFRIPFVAALRAWRLCFPYASS